MLKPKAISRYVMFNNHYRKCPKYKLEKMPKTETAKNAQNLKRPKMPKTLTAKNAQTKNWDFFLREK